MAVNILIRTPRPRVSAKPFTEEVPSQNKTMAVIILEMFESRIESQARANPSCIASFKCFPLASSSRILSKMRMLASTAIPIERINPARPAAVRVTGISLKIASDKATYIIRDTAATTPGNRYQRIMKITTSRKPHRPARTPALRAASPRDGPIVCVPTTETGSGNAP